MKLRWLRPFIVLTAALIVSISNIVSKRPVLESLIWLFLVIILFFIIASIGTRIIARTMHSVSKEEEHPVEENTEAEPAVEMEKVEE